MRIFSPRPSSGASVESFEAAVLNCFGSDRAGGHDAFA
jgi:hypothetical protein